MLSFKPELVTKKKEKHFDRLINKLGPRDVARALRTAKSHKPINQKYSDEKAYWKPFQIVSWSH